MKILILTDHFLPGYRAGGPVRSLAAIVDNLQGDIDFSILTRSTDLGETTPMSGIEVDDWNDRGAAEVYYSTRRLASPGLLRAIIRRTSPDMLYLNSFFSPTSAATLLLLRCRVLPRLPVLIAPRGEFSQGALGLKTGKKRAYISVARRLGLLSGVAWHVSSTAEAGDLNRAIPDAKSVHISPPPRQVRVNDRR